MSGMRPLRTANRTYEGATPEDLRDPSVQELLAVHDMFKRELAKMAAFVEQLLTAQEEIPHEQVARYIQNLAQAMYQYSGGLHAHHSGETEALFPELEKLGLDDEVIERLNREHDEIALLLDQLDDGLDLRAATLAPEVRRDLEQLASILRSHLDYEETHICPLLPRLGRWPAGIVDAWQRSHERHSQSGRAKAFAQIAQEEEQRMVQEQQRRSLQTGFVAGVSILPNAADAEQAFRIAALADQVGLEMVAVQDHPYNAGFMDAWTLVTALAMVTQNVTLATDVANLGLRPPAMLLKAATTLQMLSGGRVILGVGGGAFDTGVTRFGGLQVASNKDLGDAFEESLELMQRLQEANGRGVTFEGKWHKLNGAKFGPALNVKTPIWTGALKRRGLELTGKYADGWFIPLNSYVTPQEVIAMQRTVSEAAIAAGRKPTDVRRIWNLSGLVTDGQLPAQQPKGPFIGPVEWWIDLLKGFVSEQGIDGLVFWPPQDTETQVAVFAEEVLPEVRAYYESLKS